MSLVDGLVVLSIAFPIIVLTNFVLAIMIVKMKKVKEQEVFDRKRHVDVLHVSVACVDLLGSCVVYPTLIYLHRKAETRLDGSIDICKFLGSAATFYISCISNLTIAFNVHGIYSALRPLEFFVYLRLKHSKIPFLCVAVSLLVGLISLVLSACDYSLYRLKPGQSLNETACVPELQDSAVVYYYMIVVYLSYLINIAAFVSLLVRSLTRKVWRQKHRPGGSKREAFCRWLPKGAAFQLSYRLMFFVGWTPFIIVMTILMTNYDVPLDAILTSCYVVFLPAFLSPFVFYATHGDVRAVFHSSLARLHRTCCTCSVSKTKDVVIDNQDAIGLDNI